VDAPARQRLYAAHVDARGGKLSGRTSAAARFTHAAAVLSARKDVYGEFISELWAFMRERKKFWLLPIVLVLLLFGSLLVLTQGSVVAPFIYTLF
jgi:hypothetical protein